MKVRHFRPVWWLALVGMIQLSCGDEPKPGPIEDPGNTNPTEVNNPRQVGQTSFTNDEQDSSNGRGALGGTEGMSPGAANDSADKQATPPAAPPSGRTGEVEEADIYKVDQNRLFYLNTYRGFMIYDARDPKSPKLLSRLPVYGYPIEMFIQNNVVYALIRDALYLTQVNGKLQFKRHNVSQLVAIDIADLQKPKILQTIDILGELREGVSRKIDDTIYVVPYLNRYYYWGWNYDTNQPQQNDQAWVYSFNVADPSNIKLIEKLKIFEGGGYDNYGGGTSSSRNFQGVTISATSNALMVVENWYKWGWDESSPYRCGNYQSTQEAVVSIVDISDPKGAIKIHTNFSTYGNLGDQFKQTYIYDEASGRGYYLGIFARQEWQSIDCQGESFTQNTLEAWDVSDGSNPKLLDTLAFGKKNETVRGSVFDPERRVAFAITAERIDPLYALSFENPADLKVLSAVDGLSGDMNVFRFIGDKNYLVAIGRDNSDACTGFDNPSSGWSTNVAVSLIDVKDLSKIRLVQRQCVAVKNASWIGSAVNWNLDQAHKMIGMHSDGRVNVITVPVYYWTKEEDKANGWYWGHYETAVGLMTWDLAKYDPTKNEKQQNVLQNFGTLIHPNGEVKRTIVFTHTGAQNRRMVLNLSDTHLSLVDIEDLNKPVLQSVVEVAPYVSELYRFGNYMLEHVRSQQYYYYNENQEPSTFAVKPVGGKLDDTQAVASFKVGQVERVVPYKQNLVIFRRASKTSSGTNAKGYPDYYSDYETEAVIYSLADPTKPQKLSTIKLPEMMPYYRYWCGNDGFGGGFWFDDGYYSPYGNTTNSWVVTDQGLAFLVQTYKYDMNQTTVSRKLAFLDLTNPAKPVLSESALSSDQQLAFFNMVVDPADSRMFYLSFRKRIGEYKKDDTSFATYRYYAQRWSLASNKWQASADINLPGRLMKTWFSGKDRLFLTYEYLYQRELQQSGNQSYPVWRQSFRLNLLRQLEQGGKLLGELRDKHWFEKLNLKDVVVNGTQLFVNAQPDYYYYYPRGGMATSDTASSSGEGTSPAAEEVDRSDRLMIFDLSKLTLAEAYNATTQTYNSQLMGVYRGMLFINLPGDGLLAVDLSDLTRPTGQQFLRTLGWSTHLEFANNTAFVAAGHFGVYQMDLNAASTMAKE